MKIKSDWFTSNKIRDKHNKISIRQIYIWVVTKDKKVIIVSKDLKNWQFPGGKPKGKESLFETIERELLEETGVRLKDLKVKPEFFGYYFIQMEQNDKFLQLRYFCLSPRNSSEFELKPEENPTDPDQIIAAKFVELNRLSNHIPWTNGLEEYRIVLNLVRKSTSFS
jgi:8-oxo-dGTP pyrophosphatase MutT (NUDIX family)